MTNNSSFNKYSNLEITSFGSKRGRSKKVHDISKVLVKELSGKGYSFEEAITALDMAKTIIASETEV